MTSTLGDEHARHAPLRRPPTRRLPARPVTRRQRTAPAGAWVRRLPRGMLVRHVADGAGWADGLADAPAAGITVSLSSAAVAVSSVQALERRGYRYVGLAPGPAGEGGRCATATPSTGENRLRLPAPAIHVSGHAVADFLVPQPVIDAHPEWWRAFAGHAERLFSLALGPVVTTLADVLATHVEGARG